ncbi:MAG: Unknown protein [uncultured Campylobacterales bacterium]|uniref:Uncharacterized protein n=1 Tax=uncultured Campylobacterales bacterium TaxID=352960 RepID=A0A6S6SZP0_9BACT|nr:MAG: Unknown protein [uncultured Campylobacterales bacterium]
MVSKSLIYIYFGIFVVLFLVNFLSALYLFDMSEKSLIVNLKVITPHILSQGILVFIFSHLYQFYSSKKLLIYLLFIFMIGNNLAILVNIYLKLFFMVGFYLCLLITFSLFLRKGLRI